MASAKRLTPLEVPVPRPIRDAAFAGCRLLALVVAVLGLLTTGILTSKGVRRAQALSHEGVQTTATVVSFPSSQQRYPEPTLSFQFRAWNQNVSIVSDPGPRGREFHPGDTLPVWIVPKMPLVYSFEEPGDEAVLAAIWARNQALALALLLPAAALAIGYAVWRGVVSDLREGEAFQGRIIGPNHAFGHLDEVAWPKMEIEYVYGSSDRYGTFFLRGVTPTGHDWPPGKEIIVLQRSGHPPRVWETIESMEIDPKRARLP
ncbi:hypothetical protein BH11ARM2_BH11ARM2_23470 [soil metagenome]